MRLIYILVWFFAYIRISFAEEIETVSEPSRQWLRNNDVMRLVFDFLTADALLDIVSAFITIIATFIISSKIKDKLLIYLESSSLAGINWKQELQDIIVRSVNIWIWIIWISMAMWFLGLDLAIFMWWIWLWIGFTLQTFMTNFLAWIIMIIQWSYANWHLIKVDWMLWTIVKISSLSTTVEQLDWVRFLVPNIKFLQGTVINYHQNEVRRVKIDLTIDHSSDLVKVKKVVFKVLENFPGVLKDPNPNIIINKFDENWMSVSVMFWMSSLDNFFTIRSNVTETIKHAFFQSGIKIPYNHMIMLQRDEFLWNK